VLLLDGAVALAAPADHFADNPLVRGHYLGPGYGSRPLARP
jgi:hypothetical protein